MTAAEIRAQFPSWAPCIVSDETYAKPTVNWLRLHFWPWFQRQRFNLGLAKWERRNDCDNFARAYAQAAADCHALTGGNRDEGLAVGEFFYVSARGPHAIICAITELGKTYVEPQTGEPIALTPQEEQSCFFVRY